jgi:transposase-like protein
VRTKKCPTCKKAKPVAEFGRNRQSLDGLHYYCKECAAARQREWSSAHADKVRTMRRVYVARMHKLNENRDPYASD